MPPVTFTRKQAGNTYALNDINELQVAIESIDANGTFVSAGSLPFEVLVAAPTGVAATDTAAIHAARDSAGVGGVVVFRAGTYLTTGVTANVANQIWTLPPACIIQGTSAIGAWAGVITITANRVTITGGQVDATLCGATSIGIYAIGTGSVGTTTLSALANVGAKSITVTSATGMAANGILLLRSSWDPFNPETVTDRRAEFAIIASTYVSGTTVTLDSMLSDSYLISGGAVNVDRMSLLDSPQIIGVRLTGGFNTTSATQNGILVRNAADPLVRDCVVTRFDGQGIGFETVLEGNIERCLVSFATNNLYSTNNGYGILLMATENATVASCRTNWCSSGFEAGSHPNGSPIGPISRNLSWVGCHATESVWNGFGAHGSCEQLIWIGCQASRCDFAYASRAKYTTYYDCNALGVGSSGATTNGAAVKFGSGNGGIGFKWVGGTLDCRKSSDMSSSSGLLMDSFWAVANDVYISGVKIFGHTHEGISLAPNFVGSYSNIRIQNCNIDGSTAASGFAGINLTPAVTTDGMTWSDIDIIDNTVRMVTTDPPIKIVGNSATTTGNRAKRIRIAGNRLIGGSTSAAINMATGYFHGAEVVIENNDIQGVTAFSAVYSTTVAQWTEMPVVRGNLIAQSGTAGGRGVVDIRTAAPTTGTWLKGDVVLNSQPAAAGTPGWVCTTAGTPGTWKAMAVVAA